MTNTNEKKLIIQKRFSKISKHMDALNDYKELIDEIIKIKELYQEKIFESLSAQDRAALDAYLKRFSAIQDYLGSKILPMLLNLAGVPNKSMTETLYHAVKEGLIDSIEHWIELRDIRNELAHDYPDNLAEALLDLKYCIDNYTTVKTYYLNAVAFAKKHL